MRRPNKPSGYNAAAPPGHIQRQCHLDISTSNDDNELSEKLRKGKARRHSRTNQIIVAAICSLAVLGTLIYVASLVNSNVASNLLQFGNSAKIAAIHNMKKRKSNHHHHDAIKSNSLIQQNLLPPDSIYRSTMTDIHGTSRNLIQYAGSIALIVNVACE